METPIHRASPSVMRAPRGVRRSNCKQIWLRVHDPSEGMLKLLLYKILLVQNLYVFVTFSYYKKLKDKI